MRYAILFQDENVQLKYITANSVKEAKIKFSKTRNNVPESEDPCGYRSEDTFIIAVIPEQFVDKITIVNENCGRILADME